MRPSCTSAPAFAGVALAAAGVLAVAATQPTSPAHAAAAVVACAAIASLRPGVLSLGGSGSGSSSGGDQVLEALVGLVLCPPPATVPTTQAEARDAAVGSSLRAAVRHAAAVALGSVLNKWAGAESEAATARVLTQLQGTQPQSTSPSTPASSSGPMPSNLLPSLSWLARGLALKCSPALQPLVHSVMDLLAGVGLQLQPQTGATSSQETAAASAPAVLSLPTADALQAAACGGAFFRVLLSSDGGATQPDPSSASSTRSGSPDTPSQAPYGLGLGQAWHCTARALWHQRTLVTCLHRLLSQLEAAAAAPPPALLIALCAQAGAAPTPLLRPHLSRCLRWLLTALRLLPQLSADIATAATATTTAIAAPAAAALLQQELWASLVAAGGVLQRVLGDAGAESGDTLVPAIVSVLEGSAEELVQGLCAMARLKVRAHTTQHNYAVLLCYDLLTAGSPVHAVPLTH